MKEIKFFGIRLPVKELERLKEAKWELRKSVNSIVREAINEYLDKYLKKKKGKK